MSKKPTRAPKGLKGGTLKKDDGEKIKWTGHLDTEATPSISDEELARAKTIFFQNDKDENGSIDRSELQWMLKELGQNPTDEMLDQMMVRPQFGAIRRNSSSRRLRSPGHPPAQKQADGGAVGGDNDGRINMREFLRWYARGLKVKRDIAKEDVQDVFQAIAVPGAAAAAASPGSPPAPTSISKAQLAEFLKESFELEVPFVRTDKNVADFLTKPMDSVPRFFELRAKIMNERTPAVRLPPPTAGGRQNASASNARVPPRSEQ